MATLKQRVHRFNGTDYDTIHYETSSACVLLSNGNYLSSYESRLTSTLSIANGGTGQTTGPKAVYALTNACSALTSSNLASEDYFPLYDVSATTGKKILASELASYCASASGSGGGITWSSTSVGGTIQIDGIDWMIVHIDSGKYYVCKKTISYGVTPGSTTYAMSTGPVACQAVYASFSDTVKAKLNNVTVNNVTMKVFMVSYEQLNGGFSHFSSNTNRIAYDDSGIAQYWWSSSPGRSDYVYCVGTDGGLYGSSLNPSYTNGFRPFACITK